MLQKIVIEKNDKKLIKMKNNLTLANPKFILFPAPFLPTPISTFAKSQR